MFLCGYFNVFCFYNSTVVCVGGLWLRCFGVLVFCYFGFATWCSAVVLSFLLFWVWVGLLVVLFLSCSCWLVICDV